jgi:hypothetical protein
MVIVAPKVPNSGFTSVGIAEPPVFAYLYKFIVTVPAVDGAVYKSATIVAPRVGVAPENAIAVAPVDAVEVMVAC